MKQQLGEAAVKHIAASIATITPNFELQAFCQQALTGIDDLELKQRIQHIIKALNPFLPEDFIKAAEILKQIPEVWLQLDPQKQISGFAAWPIIDYASVYGLAHPQQSLALLKSLTHLFSAEFAIRPFIVLYPDYCNSQFQHWIHDDSEHVRRLVSEGTRPRLPWGTQLKSFIQDPTANISLLDKLKHDPSLYVRRSVANHLNDISKDNPDLLIDICSRWLSQDKGAEVKWIVRHATRSLVKAGHPQVLQLLGFEQNLKLTPAVLQIRHTQLNLGDNLEFNLTLSSLSDNTQKLVVDFAIHFVKANGQRKAKVFKLKTVNLAARGTCLIAKKHPIKAITTRQYYPGTQLLEILVNGQSITTAEFELTLPR